MKAKMPIQYLSRRARVLIAWQLLLLAASCSSPADRAAAAAARYEQSFTAGIYWQARLDMMEAVRLRDDVPAYWLGLARVQARMSDYRGVYDAYTHVVELEPNNLEALQNLADIARGAQRLDEAEEYADRILAIDPQDPRGRLNKGYIALFRKRHAEAHRWADRLVADYPLEEAPLLLEAQAVFMLGQRAEAIALIERAIPVRGASSSKLDLLLKFYQRTGNSEEVERTYARWLELSPEDNNLKLRYARELYLSGKFAGAEALLLPMLSSGTQPEAVADVMIQYGGAKPSAEVLERAVSGAPVTVTTAVARIALEKGYSDLAMRLMAPFIGGAMSPSVAAAASIFAAAQKDAGLPDQALAIAERVLAFDTDNPRALRVRAQVSLERRRLDAALADARVLMRDQPSEPINRTLLAHILEARGDRRQAEATFRQALNDMPGNKRLLHDYEAFQRRQKQTAGATRNWRVSPIRWAAADTR